MLERLRPFRSKSDELAETESLASYFPEVDDQQQIQFVARPSMRRFGAVL